MQATDVKEVIMETSQEGGARRSRKRSGGGRRRKTRTTEDDTTVVTKDDHLSRESPSVQLPSVQLPTVKLPTVQLPTVKLPTVKLPTVMQKPTVQMPKVVIAPPKKKPAKVLLVPKGTPSVAPKVRKTFKAKHVRMTIDNTAKTRRHRMETLAKVDAMTDDQIRATAVHARLSRRETVGKVPIGLLRQMVKDYQIMKGRLQ